MTTESKEMFNKVAAEALDQYYKIYAKIEEYRKMIAKLEDLSRVNDGSVFGGKTITSEILSMSHYMIINGLLNTLTGVNEGVRRAAVAIRSK